MEEIALQTDIEEFENYRVRLDNFEGPLDLLLHLIKDAKMDIADVKLSEITEQYLEYLDDLDSLDMEKASEFIEMAATLLEIKSKKLLPRLDDETGEDRADVAELLLLLYDSECHRLIVYHSFDMDECGCHGFLAHRRLWHDGISQSLQLANLSVLNSIGDIWQFDV